jgi:hypothetical protein
LVALDCHAILADMRDLGAGAAPNTAPACGRKVQAAPGHSVSAARSQPCYLDVTHPDANKGGVQ